MDLAVIIDVCGVTKIKDVCDMNKEWSMNDIKKGTYLVEQMEQWAEKAFQLSCSSTF